MKIQFNQRVQHSRRLRRICQITCGRAANLRYSQSLSISQTEQFLLWTCQKLHPNGGPLEPTHYQQVHVEGGHLPAGTDKAFKEFKSILVLELDPTLPYTLITDACPARQTLRIKDVTEQA